MYARKDPKLKPTCMYFKNLWIKNIILKLMDLNHTKRKLMDQKCSFKLIDLDDILPKVNGSPVYFTHYFILHVR